MSRVYVNRRITPEQIRGLKATAYRLMDRLAIVSGFSELALERSLHPDLRRTVELMVDSVRGAKNEIVAVIALLDSLPPCPAPDVD